ncbi:MULTISPECIES: tRNA (N(6)-L-threonylcarbamoyladenosine(37)-C(2))-methylthiotransferase MtaB [unclassified Hyphomonas]|jgi:threonylcarbamoyladenosine tRNA methylthiotransferase MtaB|uniref:tRNA (N(6)-L-threonylcarbamoyladenosine(37)-C(2))- methylthiotransferase MtaB n=4 Tax=Hyphomonas TaxID=85 RepID=UPI000C5696A8|nr:MULTISPECIES: tRNA (N(6)-L-threonylcarbamoyladenosine(37)-C(2))-methylthiotransferase MtaB [unclassified Hyphomonas]MAL43869.1 tRNA (N(6)-L-threonylcarbamoyladenosine(37)-C(2))-methylthiotransferase MtaB [Hyphomonas sp.]MAX84260.1 tRNA (N(6)-L-threonylcarbamoyladenosine(37)-C(2))-methylthiotransferase MtaB [Hyphomonas sp.]HBJ40133.1 tRNA (N(6)-L-threonylcarbamoyladenosine(37)-C(2))-methylthiotransferase MtaB [Hyphomonas sp.]HBU33169.1 tRNA (N(6)-L-threonylcarbamoyladenosine(37)-C(2))-methylt|tara:strand:- start:11316 stop:12593 length:1278 start_codon:yes stop_codon:yes gene_type:complete
MTETKSPSSPQLITLGCRLNTYESEVMRGHATDAGLNDAVIINTCAVTSEAVRSARQTIRRAAKDNPDAPILVTGCAAQIDPDMFAKMPEVTRVIGNHEKMQAETWRPAELLGGHEKVRVNDIMSVRETAAHLIDGMEGRARAYVQVQNGCDHRCTFCIIPYGRGNSRSVPAGEVVNQVRRLVETGHYEVVLTGVDLTSWGADLPGAPELGNLVQRILKLVPELKQLRISSIDAIEIDDALMETMAEPRLAPFMHLSLQHGDDLILKRMKRRHLRADAIALTDRLRAVRPDIAFGADIIAGFPTETEAHFENSARLVEECGLSFLHVFPYSPRPGTPAARMPQLDKAMVKTRAARLRDVGAAALERHLRKYDGQTVEALVERGNSARLPDFTPVQFESDPGEAGRPVRARIVRQDGKQLIGALTA